MLTRNSANLPSAHESVHVKSSMSVLWFQCKCSGRLSNHISSVSAATLTHQRSGAVQLLDCFRLLGGSEILRPRKKQPGSSPAHHHHTVVATPWHAILHTPCHWSQRTHIPIHSSHSLDAHEKTACISVFGQRIECCGQSGQTSSAVPEVGVENVEAKRSKMCFGGPRWPQPTFHSLSMPDLSVSVSYCSWES